MSKGKNQYVVKRPNGWVVKGEGNSKGTHCLFFEKILTGEWRVKPEIVKQYGKI